MGTDSQLGTITTQVPARLDRLPWSRFHWRVVIGLGAVWILDGLEVTMVGNVASRLTEPGSGIELTAGQIGLAAAVYITGACLGALFFGQLTDRFGRKKLFILTLVLYLAATVATAFAFAPWYFYLCRFLTGAGIGGEYAAINSAIDELIPARVRGRVDLIINGSYWLGAAAGAAGALLLLNTAFFPLDVGWRLAFGIGALFGLVVLVVRRNVPESPRWLFIHGHEDEAERIVRDIEAATHSETGQQLTRPEGSLTIEQRKSVSVFEIGKVAFKLYPKRAVLGLALFIGQAFLYNAFTFNLGTLLSTFYDVASGVVPVFFIVWALSNFAGPVLLGRLFDTVGRKPMITLAYIGSAVVATALTVLFVNQTGGVWLFIAVLALCFFLASSGASAAYLTVSEIFPMETRALAIAFFYAVGTAIGGITGPLLFGRLIESGDRGQVAVAFLIGAGVMAVAGVVEILFGVKAEGRDLEALAKPLTAVPQPGTEPEGSPPSDEDRAHRDRDARIAARAERARQMQSGVRRYRPGPAPGWNAAWREPPTPGGPETALDHEIETIARAVAEHRDIDVRELHRRVGARYWGPGEFRRALREALAEQRIIRTGRRRVGPTEERIGEQ
ncbi:MFS transporter [Mycolicibacterium thermoresistibile]